MGKRATALAERYERANDEVIAIVEDCTEEQWWSACPDDGRLVAVVARHIASGYRPIALWLSSMAAGPSLFSPADGSVEASTAQAETFADCSSAATVALLRGNGAAVAALLRALSDEQLNHSTTSAASGRVWRTEHLIDCVLFSHVDEHLSALKRALGARIDWTLVAA